VNNIDGITWSSYLGKGLPPQRTDGDLLEQIDALAARVDRLIARLAGDHAADTVSQP
jgi:hypothetical protein